MPGTRVLKVVDSLVNEGDVCAAFEKAPHLQVAGTSLASAFDEKVRVDLLPLSNFITLHAMALFSRNSMLVLASSDNPLEA